MNIVAILDVDGHDVRIFEDGSAEMYNREFSWISMEHVDLNKPFLPQLAGKPAQILNQIKKEIYG